MKKLIIGSLTTVIPAPLASSSSYFFNKKAEEINRSSPTLKAKEEVILKLPEIRKKLNDYTFRLVTEKGWGTGWILDYQLPKKGEKYPLTWYIATNHHVIGRSIFQSNDYEIKNFCDLTACDKNSLSDWTFIRRNMKGREYLYHGAIKRQKIKPPRLFFVADDFLENTEKTQYRDFAILEIEFTDEEYAGEVTSDFATKYPINTKKAINVFAPSLGKEEIEFKKRNYYNLSYPTKAGRWDYLVSWFDKQKNSSKVVGIQNIRIANCKNRGICEKERGYSYQMLNVKQINKGASGSMYIDDKGNLLGLLTSSCKAIGEKGNGVLPLRTKQISIGRASSQEYDLILGAKGQTISYKSQVEKYKKNTWLSTFKEWNTPIIV